MRNAFAVISLIFTIFSVARFGSQCQNRRPSSYQNNYRYTQWTDYSLINQEKIKKIYIESGADKYINSLYPETTFIIKNVDLMSVDESQNETYEVIAYIDDPGATDTIFYQYEMTVEKLNTATLLSKNSRHLKHVNIIECSGLKLKN